MAIPEGLSRSYSGAAVPSKLTANISDTATSLTLLDASSFPLAASSRYGAIKIDGGTNSEEVVWYSDRTGNTLNNLVRGGDGTVATTHSIGATVEHIYTALDAREANEHYANTNASFVPHSQHVHKTIGQVIPANHTFSGNINLNGSTAVTGTLEITGTAHAGVMDIDVLTGPVNFTGPITYATNRSSVGIITPTSLVPVQGTNDAPMRSDAMPGFDTRAFLRALVPAGTIYQWAGASLPGGALHSGEWAFCDGGDDNAATHPEYAANVGTTYGGTTANPKRPNFNGRVPVGADGAHGLGQTGGAITKTLSLAEIPSHNHPVTDPGHVHPVNNDTGNRVMATANSSNQYTATSGNQAISATIIQPAQTNIQIGNSGGGNAFNIEQPWAATKYIVKVH